MSGQNSSSAAKAAREASSTGISEGLAAETAAALSAGNAAEFIAGTAAGDAAAASADLRRMLAARTAAYCTYGPVSPSKLSASWKSKAMTVLRVNFSRK